MYKKHCSIVPTPDLVETLNEIVSLHSDFTLEQFSEELEKRGYNKLAPSTVHKVLSNIEITCKRICRVPKERNSMQAIAMRKEWAVTFSVLKNKGLEFIFVDESGFNINISRGRGYARVSETPECYIPSKGPNISVVAAMGAKLGLLHEVHTGGMTAVLFSEFIKKLATKVKE